MRVPMCFRSILLAGLFFCGVCSAGAGRLDLAVIQFSELVTQEQLDGALKPESLFDATNADRVIARDSVLRGAVVLFAQSFPSATNPMTFDNSTRIGNQRAEVSGNIAGGRIKASIALSEGVDAGLRRFSRKLYEGSGTLVPGAPRVLALRQIQSRTPSVKQGKTKMINREWTMAVVYQYKP